MRQLPQLNRGVLGRLGLAGGADIVNLYAARAARGFGDGFAAIILPAYLSEIGFDPFQIGVVATAALLGSAVMTLAVGLFSAHHDLRNLLLICAFLMAATGLAIPTFEYFAFIVTVVFVGTLNPSTGDISLDAFAGGFAVQSLVALWLFERFDLSLAAASIFFFWSNVLTAFSYPVAARLAKRIGLVNTMVFTHIPSSICLILAAFSPNLTIVFALLLVRSALSQMDVPTRTSYVMAVVTPAERPAAASVTAVPRSLASSISPALAGAMLATAFSGLPLVICGSLKIAYDLSLLYSFRHIRPPEERPSGA